MDSFLCFKHSKQVTVPPDYSQVKWEWRFEKICDVWTKKKSLTQLTDRRYSRNTSRLSWEYVSNGGKNQITWLLSRDTRDHSQLTDATCRLHFDFEADLVITYHVVTVVFLRIIWGERGERKKRHSIKSISFDLGAVNCIFLFSLYVSYLPYFWFQRALCLQADRGRLLLVYWKNWRPRFTIVRSNVLYFFLRFPVVCDTGSDYNC